MNIPGDDKALSQTLDAVLIAARRQTVLISTQVVTKCQTAQADPSG